MTEAGQGCLKGVQLGFIGAGNMGGAIIRGLVAGGRWPGKTWSITTRTRAGRPTWIS